ncbi:Trypsin [bacterium HR30]|nr:Trypsin [bacterium HR30]
MCKRSFGAVAAAISLIANSALGSVVPRIVNGSSTDGYPAVAMIAFYSDAAHSELVGFCSGSLVGCRTVVTAAHCVCPEDANTYQDCWNQGITYPMFISVFLPHVGVLGVESVSVHPNYRFGAGYDVSVLQLAEPADGVPPLELAATKPSAGSAGRVVGYGVTRSGFRAPDDTGIKREGPVVFGPCPRDVPGDLHVCWTFTGTGSNTCAGDSGGAVLATEGNAERLAGVVSGGSTADCQAPDESFATAAPLIRGWIQTMASDVGVACGATGLLGDGRTLTRTYSVSLDSRSPEFQEQIDLPTGAAELRVTFNGQTGSESDFFNTDNDFDLFVGHGAGSTTQWVCSDERRENWGACRVQRPQAGTWTVSLRRIAGAGPAQLTVTVFRSPAQCPNDCNGDGAVDVSEIVTAVNILLGALPVESCRTADGDGNGEVTVDEVIQGVNAALNGCSPSS